VINGFKAKQFEVDSTYEGDRLVSVYTLIETPKAFHQVWSWAMAESLIQDGKQELFDIANGFDVR